MIGIKIDPNMLPPKDIVLGTIEGALSGAIGNLRFIYPSFDPHDEHNEDTPKRIAKMWVEQFRGLGEMNFTFTTFPNEDTGDNWVIKKDIEFSSMCQHHFMPFFGKVHIGYVPSDEICGISKLDRVVDHFSKRPQVQERLGNDIKNFLQANLKPKKLVIIVESVHTCVACRGIESRNSTMVTTHSNHMNDVFDFKELLK